MNSIRTRIEAAFSHRTPLLWFIWLAVPVLCLVLPGPGVLLAAIWVIVFLWFGRQPASVTGIRKPENWFTLIAMALGIAAVIWLLSNYVIIPLSEHLAGGGRVLDTFQDLPGNWPLFFFWLTLGWIVGGIVEELVFRGFLIQIGERLLGSWSVWPVAAGGAIVFGLSHYYQGLAGMLTTGILGFLFAVIFIVSKRNLILTMLVHGFVNTISLTLAFTGIRVLG